jgi:thymidylate synthase
VHLHTRNVNTAFKTMVMLFNQDGKIIDGRVPIIKKSSRNGSVMMIDEPVTITYEKPLERVLFNEARDANPFFHLYEALWMLAGRNDVTPLAYYAKQMKEYSDDGNTLNGAYGYRWRKAFGSYDGTETMGYCIDQLDILVNHLKADPNSRRAVLQMWNVEDDLLKIGPKFVRDKLDSDPQAVVEQAFSKDVCCNLSVMFSIREENDPHPEGQASILVLDMTVTNRSNDMIWGMLGANFVHFTFLQEYMAARLGVEVGKYHHFTNNLHVYDWNWKPEEWLNDRQQDWYGKGIIREHGPITNTFPLIKDPETFEKELPEFVEAFSGKRTCEQITDDSPGLWSEPFLRDVADPLLTAFAYHKAGHTHDAFNVLYNSEIPADDWRIVATNWLKRRIK